MKSSLTIISLLLFFCCTTISYSQHFSAGLSSGINFSDIHGQLPVGKWKFMPGSVQNIYLNYSLNKNYGIQTGISYYSINYSHKYSDDNSYPIYYQFTTSDMIGPYYRSNEMMDFRFLRIPLLFTLSIPAKIQFRMKAGMFVSFLQSYNLNLYYPPVSQPKAEKHDYGYLFSSGLSYPFAENFLATFDVSYFTARKKFLEGYSYRHGGSEFSFGVEYTGFLKKKKNHSITINSNDSLSSKISVTLVAGSAYSWRMKTRGEGNYGGTASSMVGFELHFPVGKGGYFQTGLILERMGYSVKDSTSSFYKILSKDSQNYYANTKVQIDYVVIPALIAFPIGKRNGLIFKTGPWLGLKMNARTVGKAYINYHSDNYYQLKESIVYDDMEKMFKSYDIGWIAGCGVSVPVIKNYKADLELLYTAGFRDVFDHSGEAVQANPYTPAFSVNNRTISLLIGFKIPVSNK